ncbi:FAD-dependent oxidoreductase [Clostridium gasigenes]|uniref:FAD-dependent oxidoreductase n=1 Tax=Clostridium gasigenes TaxID=94869 RepID=UPI001C0C2BFD|nr:FAD-dependent oxidoreductase [Clostridium gasigenes]MBU3133837.1 FAD-dependent oxidoreductase [Clostridium gasigenes]
MRSLEIKKDIHWVGALDPNLRIFDIIMYTPYGTTYNSYVVKGSEKTAIFETVKVQFFDEYIGRLKDLGVNPNEIDYIVVDHTEPDHAGSVAKLLELSPNAKIVGSPVAINFLKKIANCEFEHISVGDGDSLSLGNKTLQFISAPFLHWPDSMYTYVVEDEVLITCDSFGSHYSSPEVFNNKIESQENYMEALKYYFDCIFGPYKPYILKAINKIKDLKIDIICPGHGPVLIDNPMKIVEIYKEWSTPVVKPAEAKKLVTIPYVSAYGYTEQLAKQIAKGIEASDNIEVKLFNVIEHEMGDIIASIGESEGILCGSPTIVAELLEPIRDVLSKLNPVVHGGKLAGAFGSYGWSGEAIPRMETRFKELNMKLYGPSLKINFKANDNELDAAYNFGLGFGETLLGTRDFIPMKDESSTIKDISGDGDLKLWKCVICGEIFEAEIVPELCPVCGAGSDQFIEIEREATKVSIDKEETYVIIGNGAAGFYAARAIRERNAKGIIKLLSNEKEHSYIRTQLSDLISEESDDKFYIVSSEWYKENEVTEILGVSVENINNKTKKIMLDNKIEISYDKLVIANGSYNFVPPTNVILDGNKTEINSSNYSTIKGIHSIKKLSDVEKIKKELVTAKNVVIVGGGLLGLEAAHEIQKRNINVTVIELADRLLPRQLDTEGSAFFNNIANSTPVNLLLGESVKNVLATSNGVTTVNLNSGKTLDADIILYSVGVRSNLDLAKTAGVECNRGVVVNSNMETNIPDIYACGDVAELEGVYYGNWPAAIEMGKVAGANASYDDIKFEKFVSSVIFNAMNTTVFSAGVINFDDELLEKVGYVDNKNNKYSKLFFQDDKLVGGILIGDISSSVKIITGIQKGQSKAKVLSGGIL